MTAGASALVYRPTNLLPPRPPLVLFRYSQVDRLHLLSAAQLYLASVSPLLTRMAPVGSGAGTGSAGPVGSGPVGSGPVGSPGPVGTGSEAGGCKQKNRSKKRGQHAVDIYYTMNCRCPCLSHTHRHDGPARPSTMRHEPRLLRLVDQGLYAKRSIITRR